MFIRNYQCPKNRLFQQLEKTPTLTVQQSLNIRAEHTHLYFLKTIVTYICQMSKCRKLIAIYIELFCLSL